MVLLLEVFTVGTVYFWVFVVAMWFLLTAAVEYEKPGLATASLLAVFGLYCYAHHTDPRDYLQDPLLLIGGVSGYLFVGLCWAFGKWAFYVRSVSDAYDVAKQGFLEHRGIDDKRIPDNLLSEWQRYVGGHYNIQKPVFKNNKGRVMTWAMYWPQSMVWTLLNDPIKKAFHSLLQATQSAFQAIADRLWADRSDDFRQAPKIEETLGSSRPSQSRSLDRDYNP